MSLSQDLRLCTRKRIANAKNAFCKSLASVMQYVCKVVLWFDFEISAHYLICERRRLKVPLLWRDGWGTSF